MRKVLLCIKIGLSPNVYHFLTRIKPKYRIPKDGMNVIFYEGFILNENEDDHLHELEIFIPFSGDTLIEDGKDLGHFIVKK